MKTTIKILIILNITVNLFGQSRSGTAYFNYTPLSEGFAFSGTLTYSYKASGDKSQCGRQFSDKFTIDNSKVRYKGKWYTASDIGYDILNSAKVSYCESYSADIYQGNTRISTIRIEHN